MPDFSATIVALATPPGMGAIAVLRLSGPEAIAIADRMFRGKKPLAERKSHTVHYGLLEDEDGRLLDEVVVALFRAPRSYTGEEVVEISCHGSPYVQQQILQACLRRGARLAEPGEFTLRAFLNGRMDLSQAEAVADLVASESAAAHDVALRQLRGGFRNEIARLRERLIHFASLVELELDFGEEDVEFADRDDLKALVHSIRQYIQSLLQSFALGNALKTGVATVIAGRPNAGKSTLLNALLNEERAIVSDIAGTTRDTIEEVLNIRGLPFRLIDTAGLREAQDQIEAIGVQRTMEKIGQAAILVYVWDVTGMTLREVYEDLERLSLPPAPSQGGGAVTAPDALGSGKESLALAAPDALGPDKGSLALASPLPWEGAGGRLLIVCNKMDRNPHFRPEWLLDPTSPDIHPYLLGIDSLPPAPSQGGGAAPDSANAAPPVFEGSLPFALSPDQIVTASAKNAQNIEYLKEKLFETVAGGALRPDATVVTNARHYDALRQADTALEDVLKGLDNNVTGDFIAQDIRRALYALGEITGEIGVEDLLGNIFSKFCIGK